MVETPAYLGIAEHFEHVCVKRFNGLVVAGEDLLLDGAQVQRVRYLLIVLAVPVQTHTQKTAHESADTRSSLVEIKLPSTQEKDTKIMSCYCFDTKWLLSILDKNQSTGCHGSNAWREIKCYTMWVLYTDRPDNNK